MHVVTPLSSSTPQTSAPRFIHALRTSRRSKARNLAKEKRTRNICEVEPAVYLRRTLYWFWAATAQLCTERSEAVVTVGDLDQILDGGDCQEVNDTSDPASNALKGTAETEYDGEHTSRSCVDNACRILTQNRGEETESQMN